MCHESVSKDLKLVKQLLALLESFVNYKCAIK